MPIFASFSSGYLNAKPATKIDIVKPMPQNAAAPKSDRVVIPSGRSPIPRRTATSPNSEIPTSFPATRPSATPCVTGEDAARLTELLVRTRPAVRTGGGGGRAPGAAREDEPRVGQREQGDDEDPRPGMEFVLEPLHHRHRLTRDRDRFLGRLDRREVEQCVDVDHVLLAEGLG